MFALSSYFVFVEGSRAAALIEDKDFVCLFGHLLVHLSVHPEAWLAGPEAGLAGLEAWLAGPEAWLAGPEA